MRDREVLDDEDVAEVLDAALLDDVDGTLELEEEEVVGAEVELVVLAETGCNAARAVSFNQLPA